MVRIHLLSQIDGLWWSGTPGLLTDDDVDRCTDLVDLDGLRRARGPAVPLPPPSRAAWPGGARDALRRRVRPAAQPHTSGLRFTRARPETVALCNELAVELAQRAPAGTPALWVTSTVRSVEHQHRLRALGYMAVLPSSHCSGHAVDVEMRWFERFGADRALARLLWSRQAAGQVNVIDEGQAWHVCVSPDACPDLVRSYRATVGA